MESLERLLFVSMSDTAGGAEKILCMMAAEKESPLIFVKHMYDSRLVIPGSIKVRYLTQGSMLLGFFKLLKALYPYRKGYTIISTHSYVNSYLGMLRRIGYLKSDLIVRECTSVFSRYTGLKKMSYRIAYNLGYPGTSLIVCQTDLMCKQLLEQNAFISKTKVLVKENPIDLNDILEKSEEPIIESISGSDFICSAGRLISEKGFPVLIQAFSNISKRYPNLKLLILGEGVERNNLNKLIKEIGLEQKIVLLGHVNNPIPYFKRAKICVVSSIKEGFPNVLLEMMAVSRSPVISTLCAGGIEDIPSIIKVKVNDVSELASAIDAVLCSDANNKVKTSYFSYRTPKKFMDSILKEAKLNGMTLSERMQ
ncbi:glycosyltransferase [Pedobacter sp. ASV1-7]|uniref:glycosyltransferase n=1 Tax=Pedobacter sp. ASV1-7 TaxID=3145237 RepID=UPI0032E8AA21